ncbi:hypothetical protein [Parachlamydia sp. AcF125]|uniref:hypothetical protein n=1 Tax=Parachlamydia sp. AcF125 TaxID=2795736 RepID=UPI001BC9C9CF|nr:hypothetical protein [Parachlamydia sp. AcF125]MBS4167530.1 hypothetical protein [Parachlamydia sp. AcF125]
MQNLFKNRHQLLCFAIALYLAPLFTLTFINLQHVSLSQSWNFLSTGLFLSLGGALLLYFVLQGWEEALKQHFKNAYVEIQPVDSSQISSDRNTLEQTIGELTAQRDLFENELVQKNEELAHQKKLEEEIEKLSQMSENFAGYRLETEQQIEEREQLIRALRQETEEQKAILQTKDILIKDLEGQIRDRNYEMQTLLKISENPQFKSELFKVPDLPVKNSQPTASRQEEIKNKGFAFQADKKVRHAEGASHHLKQCIEIAQNITGVNHFSPHSSVFRDLPVNSNALDLRRLGDSLGGENMAAVAVYSKKENKLLYANHQIRHLLGWSSEKFLQDFPEIVQDGWIEWQRQIHSLSTSNEAKIRLIMKTKFGENLLLNCHLGLIPRGIFCNHVIAVFYP